MQVAFRSDAEKLMESANQLLFFTLNFP